VPEPCAHCSDIRRRLDEPFRADDRDPTSRIGKAMRKRTGRKAGLVARQLHLDEVGAVYRLVINVYKSVRAFFSGTPIKRRRRLVLRGYEPVQEASYFMLPLTAGLELWGADRQLGRVDFRQRAFFSRRRKHNPQKAILFTAGDPALAYGVRNDPGARMLQACGLRMERDRILYLAGDFVKLPFASALMERAVTSGFMAANAYVLVRGVMAMASGKVGNQEQQQQWMRKRVLYQGIAIFIAAAILLLAGGGK